MRLDGLGTSLLLASSSPAFGLAVRSCSYSRTFACCFFQPGPHGIGLAVQLPLPPSVRSGSFHPDSSCPCRAHERRLPAGSRHQSYVDAIHFVHLKYNYCPCSLLSHMIFSIIVSRRN